MDVDQGVWVECGDCDDYFCSVHNLHAYDCSCPSIDVWASAGLDPYVETPTDAIKDWLADNEWVGEDH